MTILDMHKLSAFAAGRLSIQRDDDFGHSAINAVAAYRNGRWKDAERFAQEALSVRSGISRALPIMDTLRQIVSRSMQRTERETAGARQ